MAQQLAPDIGTLPTGGMVSVDVEGRRSAVGNVDGTLFALLARRAGEAHRPGEIGRSATDA